MIQNHLTARQLDNFSRRARFTVCGEPCDVLNEPWPYQSHLLFVTINHNTETGASWLEATHYSRYEGIYTTEAPAAYISKCRKVPEAEAREIIAREVRRWAGMPDGTITGYTPAQLEAEAERIASA